MAENADKVPITLVGPEDVEFGSPPVSTPLKPTDQVRGLCPCIWGGGVQMWVLKYVHGVRSQYVSVQGARDARTRVEGAPCGG